MSARPGIDAPTPDMGDRFDAELRAFLEREAARRLSGRRSDAELVAAIAGRARGRSGGRFGSLARHRPWQTAAAALALVILVVGAFVVGREFRLIAGAASTPIPTDPPLRLTELGGPPCPLTGLLQLSDGLAPGLGDGPVRGVLAAGPLAPGTAFYERDSRWQRIDILWVAETGFSGRVLLRAAGITGRVMPGALSPDVVSFGDALDPTPLPRLVLDGDHGQPIGTTGWSVLAAQPLLVKGPGCYAIQIDTDSSSSVIAFAANAVGQAYDQMEGRPLRLPTLSSGDACPVTPPARGISFVGGLLGDGPIFVGMGGGITWWVADPREVGPIIVRGGRIDGPGELAFGTSSGPSELRLPIHSSISSLDQPPGWRQFIWPGTNVVTSAPGCYAVQVDTLSGSQILVFQAR